MKTVWYQLSQLSFMASQVCTIYQKQSGFPLGFPAAWYLCSGWKNGLWHHWGVKSPWVAGRVPVPGWLWCLTEWPLAGTILWKVLLGSERQSPGLAASRALLRSSFLCCGSREVSRAGYRAGLSRTAQGGDAAHREPQPRLLRWLGHRRAWSLLIPRPREGSWLLHSQLSSSA